MAQTITVPDTAIPIGDTIFGPFPVSAGVASITLKQSTSRLPNTGSLLAEAAIETSPDGVQPFVPYASTGVIGGVVPVTPKNPSGTLNTTFNPFPSPCQVRIKCHAFVAFTLTDLQVILA